MALIECYECSKQISDAAAACPSCGAPVKKKVSEGYIPPKHNKPVAPTRKLGILLIIGILVFPYIFSWFLLRKGYSVNARTFGFCWLGLFIVMPYLSSHKTSAPSSYATSTTTSVEDAVAREARDSAAKKEAARREQAEIASLTMFTAPQIAQAYEANTVAADQIFKNKRFRVSGVISSINTDFLGKPYITLKGGVNQFMEPQFGFDKDQMNVVAGLRKGQKVVLACEGHGDVAKTPMSGDCQLL